MFQKSFLNKYKKEPLKKKMTNIWTDSYKAIREPFFEIGDPYITEEKKEKEEKGEKKHKEGKAEEESEKSGEKENGKSKRWWDDDGDGKGYEKGEVEGSFKKKVKKEEFELWVESLVEEGYDLSDLTWDEMFDIYEAEGSYGATPKAYSAARDAKMTAKRKPFLKKMLSRTNPANRTSSSSDRKGLTIDDRERARAGSAHGVGTRQDHDYPSQGPGGVTKSAKKLRKQKSMGEFAKEERELHSKTDKNEKIDVRRGIKNKIEVNPRLKEEVEEWVNQLVEEGYDLSDFTWDEMFDIYESVELDEVSSYGMPPAGDAQREKPDPLQAAKRRAAQAQVRKELSDLQVAKARSTAKLTPTSEEAIFSYLENRYDFSEGVFDPKKTKLRSASERKASELSPAQKKAAEMKQKRSERLEAEADKVLRQVRGGGSTRKSSKPMGSEAPKLKAPAPEANRKLGKQKQDTLAKKASDVLKDVRNK
jgi:hypothetical protein